MMRAFLLAAFLWSCNAVDITVSSAGGKAISPYQYGLMFEDINYCGDGGLYGELIRNRAFQTSKEVNASLLQAWSPVNGAKLATKTLSKPLSSALPISLNVAASNTTGQVGFANEGYWGIPVAVQSYAGSFFVKGTYNGTIVASLHSDITKEEFGSIRIPVESTKDAWTQFNYTLIPVKAAKNANNSFQITFDAKGAIDGSLDFNLISLFPPTYKNRKNGLRKDLAEALQELNPSFLRFPGGNDLEGKSRPTRWIWNETIGPLQDRPGRPSYWDYQETSGFGLIEYLNWCDDFGMEPILAVWAGLSLDNITVVENQIQPYIQEALDVIEFITGSVETKNGALRASLGYPKPWKLRYVEVGNEDNLNNNLGTYTSYRFPAFLKAINQKFPDIIVLSSTSHNIMSIPKPAGGDYHEYTMPDNFVNKFHFFDNLTVPTIVGEYATVYWNNPKGVPWGEKFPKYPWWLGSVAEAIFLIGAERNSALQKVIGSTYAPTFMNVNLYQWSPTLIAFSADPAHTTKSTSHHVLKLLSTTRVTHNLETTSNSTFGPLYYVAGKNNDTGAHIFKAAVYNSTASVPVSLTFQGIKEGTKASLTVLTTNDPWAWNTVEKAGTDVVQNNITTIQAGAGGVFRFTLPAVSVSLLKTL